MSVLKMQKITLCAMKKNRKRVLEALQSYGVVEIISHSDTPEGFAKMDTSAQKYQFEKTAASVDQSLDVLQKYAPAQTSMLSSLAGRDYVSQKAFANAMDNKKHLLGISSEINQLEKTIAENQTSITKDTTKIDSLLPWESMDIPLNTEETASTDIIIGTLDREAQLSDVMQMIAEEAPDAKADVTVVSASKNQTCLVVICLKKDSASVENALRANGFARASFVSRRTSADKIARIREHIAASEKAIEQAKQQLVDLAENRKDLQQLSDYFRIRAEKYEVLGGLDQSENTFFISGYIPERDAKKVSEVLAQQYEAVVSIEEIAEDEEAPVELSNNTFSGSTEGVVSAYGLPKKGEVDPTTVMSFFYVFFFGMMLSDAAYGLLIAVACGFALLKFKTMEEGLKKSLRMFFYCGLSTLIWGLIFGGFFGDVVTVVAATFFQKDVTLPPLWFAPIDDPMRLLLYSLLFGIIHLFTGLGMKGYMLIKEKKYLDCICDIGLWYAFLIGLILMLIPTSLFASIAGQQYHFPAALNMLAKVLTIVGLIGIILMSGRQNKNWGLRIALGLYDIYNVTGWLSDVLSYSRLLALGLATGVIAQVVNSMASMVGTGVVGTILFIVIFLVGHTLNLAINLLGAYVHTNRLQYVEFFGKFYEGGGRPFNPFKQNTKYIRIKEDN